MSLSARIAVRASRRLEALACGIAIGGIVVASFTAVHRWPDFAAPFLGPAIGCAVVVLWLAARRVRTATRHTLSVSDRSAIAVSPDVESGDGESWRLDDSTMMWPGFSIIGLRKESDAVHGNPAMRLAVFDAESSAIDRRALHRFLLWSLRGGEGKGADTRANAAR